MFIMKKKNIIAALALSMVVGLGATAYAAGNGVTAQDGTGTGSRYNCSAGMNCGTGSGFGKGSRMGQVEGFRGSDILTGLLESKGVTADEIAAARDSGKTLRELLNDKGVSDADINSYMLSERSKLIDAAVADGRITAEQADQMKANMKENIGSFNGAGGERGNRGMNCQTADTES
jgi:polyhydroxyalkanoate synthesis regulator phasin